MECITEFKENGKNGELISFGIDENNQYWCEIKYENGDISSATRKCMVDIHGFIKERNL
jgi:hypothetical protein